MFNSWLFCKIFINITFREKRYLVLIPSLMASSSGEDLDITLSLCPVFELREFAM